MRLVAPETATAVATLLLFTELGVVLGNRTIELAMIAFCIPFVTVVVRSRLASINPEIEQGALDLGATPLRSVAAGGAAAAVAVDRRRQHALFRA